MKIISLVLVLAYHNCGLIEKYTHGLAIVPVEILCIIFCWFSKLLMPQNGRTNASLRSSSECYNCACSDDIPVMTETLTLGLIVRKYIYQHVCPAITRFLSFGWSECGVPLTNFDQMITHGQYLALSVKVSYELILLTSNLFLCSVYSLKLKNLHNHISAIPFIAGLIAITSYKS